MYIGDIIILLIALIVFIVGCKKGLLKRITSLLAWVGSIALTSVLHDPLLEEMIKKDSAISCVNIINKFDLKIMEWFSSKSPVFSESLSNHNEQSLSAALSEINVPSFLHSHFTNGLSDAINSPVDYTLGSYLASIISAFAFSILVYIVLFLLIFLILRLVAHYIDKLRDVFVIGFIDGVLGGIYSLLKLTFVVSLIFLLLTYLVNGTGFGKTIFEFLSPYMGLEEEGFSICKYLYYENPILQLISAISFDELIDKILPI